MADKKEPEAGSDRTLTRGRGFVVQTTENVRPSLGQGRDISSKEATQAGPLPSKEVTQAGPLPSKEATQAGPLPSKEATQAGPVPGKEATQAGATAGSAGRRRFSDSEGTVVMPLAEILRARQSQVPGGTTPTVATKAPPPARPAAGGFGSQATVIMRMPELPRRPTSGSKPAGSEAAAAGAAREAGTTQVARMEPTQPGALLDRSTPPTTVPPAKAPAEPSTTVPAPAPQTAPVAAPIEAASEPPLPPTTPTGRHSNIVVFSCKGGAGATLLSLNIAHFAATKKRASCLMDLDLQFGDALAGLGLSAGLTVSGALGELAKKQPISSERLPRHASGLSVLSQAGVLEEIDQVRSDLLPPLVENLRAAFDLIVYDGARDFSDNTLAVLDLADKIILVVVQEVLAVRRARSAFAVLRKIGFDPADIIVVINRARADSELTPQMLTSLFTPARVVTVPDERQLALESLNRATPLIALQPTHALTRALGRVAAMALGLPLEQEQDADAGESKGFWGRKGSKAGK